MLRSRVLKRRRTARWRGTPEHQLAVLTVLAYYFERCDIFEEPLENTL